MKKLKVAVIGCGFFGSMHAEIFATMDQVELSAVVDVSEMRAEALASRLSTTSYTDYNEVLERGDIDVIDICVPDSMHTDVMLAAIAHRKHILVEKPLADSVDCARRLLDATMGYNKKVMVGHICRFDIRYEKAFQEVQNGDLGEIIYITSKRNSPTLGAKRYSKYCKLLTHSGIHDIDLVRWFVGSEYEKVYAVGRSVRLIEEGMANTHDSIQAIFTFKNGVTYTLENTWALPNAFPSYIDASIQIIGTKRAIYIDFFDQGYRVYTDEQSENTDISFWPDSLGIRTGDLRFELKHFVDCINFDLIPRVSPKDAYEVVVAAAKAMESVKSGLVVSIK